jgi:hypothetical protein
LLGLWTVGGSVGVAIGPDFSGAVCPVSIDAHGRKATAKRANLNIW